MTIDELFNDDKAQQGPVRRGAVRALLRDMLAHQEEASGHALGRAERQAYLEECYRVLRNPVRRPAPFCERVIKPEELYYDVSEACFCVSDEAGQFDWLGTAGAARCAALVLRAHASQAAPATAAVALFRPGMDVEENIGIMLSAFHETHRVDAVLAGRDVDLDLASDITIALRGHGLKTNADLGMHAAIAVHVGSNDIIGSPQLPAPMRKMRGLHIFPLFERIGNPDREDLLSGHDDRGRAMGYEEYVKSLRPD